MTVKENINKSWKNESYHSTYEQANLIRNKLLDIWTKDDQHKGMQVKIKRLSRRYVVKTRLHPDFDVPKVEKKGKKRGKNSRRNRKNSETRMFDASATV